MCGLGQFGACADAWVVLSTFERRRSRAMPMLSMKTKKPRKPMLEIPEITDDLMGLSGLGYIVQGWVLGSEGFSETDTFAILGGYVLILAWIIWLLVVAWRTKESSRAATP
jgi:hypothetical protein